MPRIARSFLVPAILSVALGAATLPAAADHVPASHDDMENLFTSPVGDATSSDLAFWGNYAYVGNYGGFRTFDITNPAAPLLVNDYDCFGPQNDISVWDRDRNGMADILFTSVDSVLEGPQCGRLAAPAAEVEESDNWEGIRIFDISDPANPSQLGSIYQDCGSHTHTLWPDPKQGRVLLYNSSYSLRAGPTCGPTAGPAAGRDPLHGVIQVVEVSWDKRNPLGPVTATEIAEPPISYPSDPDNTFDPQEHGLPDSSGGLALTDLRACHDIGVFVQLRLAAGACAEQAQLWRVKKNGIPNTANPLWVYDEVSDPTGVTGDPNDPGVVVDFWHSATFSWDGKIVNFIDESFGSGCPTTTTAGTADGDSGRMFFLNRRTGEKISHFMINRPSTESSEYCSAHLGNVIPTPDKYLLVNAWYTGGANVVDFTNPAVPQEVAFWDFDPEGTMGSDNWSHYWYQGPAAAGDGVITYGNDGVHNPPTGRGFETFRVSGLTRVASLPYLNPQTQEVLAWCKGKPATHLGTVLSDFVKGTAKKDVVATGPGKDRVVGGKKRDTVCGGDGRDKVSGSGGPDLLVGQKGKDNLRGGAGRDVLVGGPGKKDRCHGGPGNNVARRSCEKQVQV